MVSEVFGQTGRECAGCGDQRSDEGIACEEIGSLTWTDRSGQQACSVGRKTLTSPDDGFSVPTNATTTSGQKSVTKAKLMPVTIISIDA